MRARLAAALALSVTLAAGLPGCGDSKPATVAAGGKVVFRKSIPAAGALVVFHALDPAAEKRNGGKPVATVGEDGTFKLTMYAAGDGAPEGEYGVTVDWQKKAAPGKFSLSGEGGGGTPLLNPKYGNPAVPVFKFTVKKGEKNDFYLEVD